MLFITNARLVFKGKIFPRTIVFGIRIGAIRLQKVAVGSTESIGCVHELRHFAVLQVQQALQHAGYLVFGSRAYSCMGTSRCIAAAMATP